MTQEPMDKDLKSRITSDIDDQSGKVDGST